MSKIHVLETSFPQGESPVSGSVRVLFHVNIPQNIRSANVEAGTRQEVGQLNAVAGTRLQSGTVYIGPSKASNILGTHPDHGVVTESVLLAGQELVEVEAQVTIVEGEDIEVLGPFLDALYPIVQSQAQTLYGKKFGLYSASRNPS